MAIKQITIILMFVLLYAYSVFCQEQVVADITNQFIPKGNVLNEDYSVEFRLECEAEQESCFKVFDENNQAEIFVSKEVSLSIQDIHSAEVDENLILDQKGNIREDLEFMKGLDSLVIKFTSEGKEKLKVITENNIGKKLTFFINEKLISAPNISMPITNGVVQITGVFSENRLGLREIVEKINERTQVKEHK